MKGSFAKMFKIYKFVLRTDVCNIPLSQIEQLDVFENITTRESHLSGVLYANHRCIFYGRSNASKELWMSCEMHKQKYFHSFLCSSA